MGIGVLDLGQRVSVGVAGRFLRDDEGTFAGLKRNREVGETEGLGYFSDGCTSQPYGLLCKIAVILQSVGGRVTSGHRSIDEHTIPFREDQSQIP